MRGLFFLVLLLPLAQADVVVSHGGINEVGGVALSGDSFQSLWTTFDNDAVRAAIVDSGTVGEAAIIASAPPGYFTRDILSDARNDRAAVVVLYWPELDGSNRAELLTLEQGAWTRRDVPLDALHRNVGGVAIAPDGTTYVGRSGGGGQDLLTYAADGMSTTLLSPSLGFNDVSVDDSGVPHACVSTPSGLVEWTPAGTRMILPFVVDLNAYFCAISVAPNGSAAALAAQPPLIGGSCLTPDLCAGTPGAGNVVSATRQEVGEWSYVPSGIPFFGGLELGRDPEGRFFGSHEEGNRDRIFALTSDGIQTRQFVQDPWGSSIPTINLAAPAIIARVDAGGPSLELRLVEIAAAPEGDSADAPRA